MNFSGKDGVWPGDVINITFIAAQLIRERRKTYYNQRSHNLDALEVNDKVPIQDDEKSVGTTKRWNRTGTIVKVGSLRPYQLNSQTATGYGETGDSSGRPIAQKRNQIGRGSRLPRRCRNDILIPRRRSYGRYRQGDKILKEFLGQEIEQGWITENWPD